MRAQMEQDRILERKDAGRRAPWWRRRRWLVISVAITVALALWVFQRPLVHGNFGELVAGKVYRSAQPHGRMRQILLNYQIASVLNLRGGSDDDPWYVEEVRETDDLKVDLYDFPMSATRRPSRRELLVLLDLFERCRYPLLIHCKSGSDRTGLACALYLTSQRGESPEQALRAFSIFFGHVPLGGPQHLHEPLLEYNAWLRERGLTHTPARFLDWVKRDYRDDEPLPKFTPLRPGPRAKVAAENRAAATAPIKKP